MLLSESRPSVCELEHILALLIAMTQFHNRAKMTTLTKFFHRACLDHVTGLGLLPISADRQAGLRSSQQSLRVPDRLQPSSALLLVSVYHSNQSSAARISSHRYQQSSFALSPCSKDSRSRLASMSSPLLDSLWLEKIEVVQVGTVTVRLRQRLSTASTC